MNIKPEEKQIKYFFSDLDHTLIFSHRVTMPCEKRVVEILNGKNQSYMTEKAYSFFNTQNIVQFIPVTTRSKKQYKRISVLQESFPPQYALICNGGILLINGIEDNEWSSETQLLISNELTALEHAKKTVQRLATNISIHNVNDMFFYVKHDFPEQLSYHLKQELSLTTIQILYDTRKVYCLPSSLHKGVAIERFKKRFGAYYSIAAGDSIFDVPMLNSVDTALFPESIKHLIHTKDKISIRNPLLSEGICEYLNTL